MLALLLALMLLGSLSMACAETVSVEAATIDFDVSMVIPDGYTMTEERENSNLYIDVLPDDVADPEYWISIGYSEEYDGRTISEFSQEELDEVTAVVTDAFVKPACTNYTTKEGTLVYMFDETEGESDWAMALTVYKGYFITVQIEKDDYSTLSDADLQLAIDLLGDMHFVDN